MHFQPAPTIAHMIRNAALLALSEAAREAHTAGNIALRDRLADRWHAAVASGVSTRAGIASLSHT